MVLLKHILLTLLIVAVRSNPEEGELKLVHVFFRHGSRTPDIHEVYATDPNAVNDFYPTGHGQLTNEGKQMAYTLGKLLRQRYGNFLGDLYTPDLIRVQSTDTDRTKMSAMLVLAGLLPPSVAQKWDENLIWMPIPYQYEKFGRDYELGRPNSYCPAYQKELERIFNSEVLKRVLKEQSTHFQYISKHAGQPISKLSDMFNMFQVLHAEKNMNMTLPKWTNNVYPNVLRNLAAQQCYFENYTPLLRRLSGGRIVKKVTDNMVKKSKHELKPKGRKLYLYSGHDYNVVNPLAFLDLYTVHFPNYSSAVAIELRHVELTNEYFVKIIYIEDIDLPPKDLTMPSCSKRCTLERFVKAVENFLPTNYTKECESQVLLDVD